MAGILKIIVLAALVAWIFTVVSGRSDLSRTGASATTPDKIADKYDPARHVDFRPGSWRREGFGNIAILDSLTVANHNPEAIKDVEVLCKVEAPSGTGLGRLNHTLYEIVPPGKSRTFRSVNFGFVNSQAARVGCAISAFKYKGEYISAL